MLIGLAMWFLSSIPIGIVVGRSISATARLDRIPNRPYDTSFVRTKRDVRPIGSCRPLRLALRRSDARY